MLDPIDRKILDQLQRDATLSVADLADRVGLTTTPCWRRLQKLEAEGIIKGRVALLDANKLNIGTTVFVAVRTAQHNAQWLEAFSKAVQTLPEIVEVHRLSGETDYLLKVQVPDIAAYDRVYKRLIAQVDLFDVSSSFSMETLKATTVLPLSYAAG